MAKGLLSKLTNPFRSSDAAPEVAPKALPKVKKRTKVKTEPPKEDKVWPATRLNVVERVWGEGYITPGGPEQVKKLLPLLALDKKKSVLLLGAGLGGINQTMVEETGVWVTGLERDRELAELGHASMVRANLKRQAPVRYSTLENLELKPKSFDAVLSFEGTDAVADKKALFSAVAESLRVHGELMF
ncbi:MAG TPA: class I SAM-dependent methyltransferase, partial [Magnetovibrio sp.]